jgi:glycosyltransferase involved in cell wall biosynthesis
VQLLAAAEPAASGIRSVTVWGAPDILDQLPDAPWLQPVAPAGLGRNGLSRAWWQQRGLGAAARRSADLLFSPGGTYLGSFRPFVTMFRNMLPFDAAERRRYGASVMRLKMELLRAAQTATFRRADGVIFLNDYARLVIRESSIAPAGMDAVIPHGLDARFFTTPSAARPFSSYSTAAPFRWLYVSAVHDYKRPWNVAEAAASLRAAGRPITLDLVGPPYPAALRRLRETLDRVDPAGGFITAAGGVAHRDLPECYRRADAFVFASTCENMPNSLLEAMAAGLPIACSDRQPMPEILGDGGVYFNPEVPASIAAAMVRLMDDQAERTRVSAIARNRATRYSWSRTAKDTFDFLARVGRQ